jgi:hypothetical protein
MPKYEQGSGGLVRVVEYPPVPQQYYSPGDPDYTNAFNRLFAAGKTGMFVPPGVYPVSATLIQPPAMDVVCDPAAIIRAVSAIAGPLWQTPIGAQLVRKSLHGGVFDCNGLAATGIDLYWVGHYTLEDVTILSPTGDFLIVGDTAAGGFSFEAEIRNLMCYAANAVAGSRGVWLNKSDDCRIQGATVTGADIGVRAEAASSDHVVDDVHVWGSPVKPSICFDDAGTNRWLACSADTPAVSGFRLRASGSALVAPMVFLSTSGVDNTVVGVVSDTGVFTAAAAQFVGADGAHRLAQDFSSITSATVDVARSINVVVATVVQSLLQAPTVRAPVLLVGATAGHQIRATANAVQQFIQHNDGLAFTDVNSATIRALIGTDGAVSPGNAGAVGGAIRSGTGVPSNAIGANGDLFIRTDTPGTALQRIYIRSAGAYVGIV